MQKKCMKMCFADKASARRYIKETTARINDNRMSKLRPYDCPKCDYWHLTSQSKVESRRIKKKMGER